MQYYIPGKTFLVGEYSALLGGPALGFATEPCFKVEYNKKNSSCEHKFHPESIAGLLYQKKNQFFKDISISFTDPYKAQGGFGCSTAEFLSVIIPQIENVECPHKLLKAVWEDYKKLSSDVIKPSGYDLLFQLIGKVTHIDPQLNKFHCTDWPFLHLGFSIVATGTKLKTHQHLKTLDENSLSGLPELSQRVVSAFFSSDEKEFLTGLKNWVNELDKRKLIAKHSFELRIALEAQKEIILVKPCGAMGSDTLIVFYKTEDKEQVWRHLQEMKLKVLSTQSDLHAGLLDQLRNKNKNIIDDQCKEDYVD